MLTNSVSVEEVEISVSLWACLFLDVAANIMLQKLPIVFVTLTVANRATGVRSALDMVLQIRHAFLVLRTESWVLVLVIILVPSSAELKPARPTGLACPFYPEYLNREDIDSWRIVDMETVTESHERL